MPAHGYLDWLSGPAHDLVIIASIFGGFDREELVKRLAFKSSNATRLNITTVCNVLQDMYDEDHEWDNVT